jgi:hypothetical protein
MQTLNPMTGEPLREEAAAYVASIRQVQRSARKDTRSGNPAKRAAAKAVLASAPRLLAAVYVQEVGK